MVTVTGLLRADTASELRSERVIGPGVKCTTLIRKAGPWVIRIIEADGESGFVRPGITFGAERGLRAATVRVQAQRATQPARYPIAGVNGDFFAETPGPFEAEPVGALVVGGEVIHTPYPRSAFLMGADGRYAIRRLRLAAWVEGGEAAAGEHEQEHEQEGDNGARRVLTGVNQPCGANDLVLYTPRFGLSTRTKAPVSEVTLTGLALPVRLGVTYQAQAAAVGATGDAPIPAEGVVLAGRGAAGAFLGGLKAGDDVRFRLDFDPPVGPETDVIGGGPTLVRDGRVVVTEDTEGFQPDVVSGRAPRTAVGFNGRRLLLVTVDGREPGVSAGMSLIELAALMRELGCTDAMNLDGGGSTTAWVRGAVVSYPSAGQERRVAEGFFLFSTAPPGPAVRLALAPEGISLLVGASCPLAVTGEDEYENPVPAPAGPLAWQIDPDLGSVDAGGRLTIGPQSMADGPQPVALIGPDPLPGPDLQNPPTAGGAAAVREGSVSVRAGELTGSVPVRVYARPPRLVVSPPRAGLPPGGKRQFAVRALDDWGRPLITEGVPARWSCPPELGQVDDTGLFQAAATPARGVITVEIAGTQAAVPVTVAPAPRPLDGVDAVNPGTIGPAGGGGGWSVSTVPPEVIGSLAVVEDAAHPGQRCLRLAYDFSAGQGTRAVYANTRLPLGRPAALRVQVRGDGGGAWLRARLRDARGHAQVVDFSRRLGRLDAWQTLAAPLSPAWPGPLTLEAVYLVETDPQAQPKGAIDLAGLAGG